MEGNCFKIRKLRNSTMVLNIQMLDDITKLLRVEKKIDKSCGLSELFAGMFSLWISQALLSVCSVS